MADLCPAPPSHLSVLADALSQAAVASRIKTLDLSGNTLGPAGAPHVVRILQSVSGSIKTLDVSHCRLGRATELVLAAAAQARVQVISVAGNGLGRADGVAQHILSNSKCVAIDASWNTMTNMVRRDTGRQRGTRWHATHRSPPVHVISRLHWHCWRRRCFLDRRPRWGRQCPRRAPYTDCRSASRG